MKALSKPNNNIEEILDNCILTLREPRKSRVVNVKDTIIAKSSEYDELATKGNLYKIPIHDNVDNIASKSDMEFLYTSKFVPKTELNRKTYDYIKSMAPNGICPYCQQNQAETVDHFLPKSKYVTYTVSPYNLVPACLHCNKDKSAPTFNSYRKQPFHPYYDDFDDTVWIKARLIERDPISFQFYAEPDSSISRDKAERIKNSFSSDGYSLNDVYKIHAPELFRPCIHRIKILYDQGGRSLATKRLLENIEDERYITINSWKAAMYQAMIDSDWFWTVYLPNKKN